MVKKKQIGPNDAMYMHMNMYVSYHYLGSSNVLFSETLRFVHIMNMEFLS